MSTIQSSGGGSATATSNEKYAIDTNGNVHKVPNFTIKEILDAIPSKCYERNLALSLYYVARDVVCMLSIGLFTHKVAYPWLFQNAGSSAAVQLAKFAFWFAYTYAQGLFSTGLWVLAHECGHQAFSDYGAVNDFVGWTIHSYLLVPYFSWKYSHSKHHKSTNHMTRDMVFVPPRAEEFKERRGLIGDMLINHSGDSPLRTLGELLLQQLGGWIAYITTNVTGQKYEGVASWKQNHFYPFSPLYEKKDYFYIFLSDVGIVTQLLVLKLWFDKFGGWSLFINWFVPYIWTNHWLVFITYLQHTDPTIAHYDANEWTFARGAASTVDRKFGFVGPHIFHDIIETHVLHHFCSRVPFYNAREASAAIVKVMGDHYKSSDENMWKSLWNSAKGCQYVEGEDGVLMFRNVNNFGIGTGADGSKKQK